MSDSLLRHGLQRARLPCPSPSPGVCSNSCPLSWWSAPFPFGFNLSQQQGLFQWVSSSYQVAKVLVLLLQHQDWEAWPAAVHWVAKCGTSLNDWTTTTMSKSVISVFSSKSFRVYGLTFRSLIHFEFIFVYGVRKYSSFILLHVAVQFSQYHLLKRLSFLTVYSCLLCQR